MVVRFVRVSSCEIDLMSVTRTVTALATSIGLGLLVGWILPIRSVAQSLDRATCEADGEFVWILESTSIFGSDRAERDYAYQLSAETAAAGDPERVDAIAQGLRQARWFEGEFDRQERTLPG